jgi:hypothetical protein
VLTEVFGTVTASETAAALWEAAIAQNKRAFSHDAKTAAIHALGNMQDTE